MTSGSRRHASLKEAEKLISEKRAVWIEKNVSAMMLADPNLGRFDYSGEMGPRVNWTPRMSGGALVLQLL